MNGQHNERLLLQSIQMVVDISLNEISINYIESTKVQLNLFYPQVEEVTLMECELFYQQLEKATSSKVFEEISNLHFIEIRSAFPRLTQRKIRESLANAQVNYCEKIIKEWYEEFCKTKSEDSPLMIKAKKLSSKGIKGVGKSKKKFGDDEFNKILGNQEQERIAEYIKSIVNAWESGSKLNTLYTISKSKSVNFCNRNRVYLELEEETKGTISESFLDVEENKWTENGKSKEDAAFFFLHVMSVERDTVLLLNNWHKNWINAEKEFDIADNSIMNENLTRRIPEHLDEDDKKRFELIRQASSFRDDTLYSKYYEPETLEILKKMSIDNKVEEFKIDDIDYDEFDDMDNFEDDLDSLLLGTPSVPTLTRD